MNGIAISVTLATLGNHWVVAENADIHGMDHLIHLTTDSFLPYLSPLEDIHKDANIFSAHSEYISPQT